MSGNNTLRPFARISVLLCAGLLAFSCTDELLDTSRPVGPSGVGSDSICFGVFSSDEMTKASGSGLGRILDTDNFILRSKNSSDTLCVTATITEGIDLPLPGGEMPLTRAAQVSSLDTYGGFYVQAHIAGEGEGGTPDGSFFMDDDVTNQNGGIWSTDINYYWPGEGYQLKFYAWAPADAFSSVPGTPESTELVYAVPEDVADQHDLLVAVTPDDIQGDYNQAVALTFRHILTAVKFEVGSQMQPGTIKSVALKGIIGGGTYDMAADKWELGAAGSDYIQTLDKSMSGSEQDGSAITAADGFFMMIPQPLPEGAEVEVVFNDGISGDRTMTADIGGTQWLQGMTVTYKLSISPEYELEFTSEPEIQDAHYIIYPITIKSEDVPGGEWTMSVRGETDIESSPVTLRTDLTPLTRRGFWIDEDKGEVSIKGSSTGENITVYAFLKENIGDASRDITLELRPSNAPDAVPATFTITQLCPSWNDDLGCERIEEYDEGFDGYPWGFLWEKGLEIRYDLGNWLFGGHTVESLILSVYLGLFNSNPWVDGDTEWEGLNAHYVVTFSFDNIPELNIATNLYDGLTNTLELYNFEGLNDASSMMQMLEEWEIKPDKDLPSNPTVFAARTCALKNKFHKEISYENGQEVQRAVLYDAECVWYLPAQNEAPNMKDNDYPLSGEYWTSTAVDDNQHAYKYTVGGSTSQEIRTTNLHVRAVRQRP